MGCICMSIKREHKQYAINVVVFIVIAFAGCSRHVSVSKSVSQSINQSIGQSMAMTALFNQLMPSGIFQH